MPLNSNTAAYTLAAAPLRYFAKLWSASTTHLILRTAQCWQLTEGPAVQALQGLQGYGATPEALGLGLQHLAQARMYAQPPFAASGNGYQDRALNPQYDQPLGAYP